MANKILQVANNSAYRHLGPQTELEKGLVTLGTHLVRMVVINESVVQNLNVLPAFRPHDLRFFWRHSLKTALIARKTARHLGLANIDEAYLAGLLHDIGRLALLAVVPDLYRDLFYLPASDKLCDEEQKMLGMDHTEASAYLIRMWKFDDHFIDSIASHHSPLQPHILTNPLARIVHMSNQLADCQSGDTAIASVVAPYVFPAEIARQIVMEAENEVLEAATRLGIVVTDPEPASHPGWTDSPPSPLQQQMNQELSTLIQASELARFFQSNTTLAQLQDAALKAASALFSLKNAILVWRDSETGQCKIVAANQTVEQLLGHPVSSPPEGALTRALSQKMPQFIAHIDEFSSTPEKNIARLLGGNNWLLLPLAGSRQCMGLIFSRVSTENLVQLQADKYRLLYFGEQFVLAWQALQGRKNSIREKVALAEEKHRRISSKAFNEMSSPLTVIRNYLFILNKQLDEKPEKKKLVAILNEEIQRLGDLVREMGHPDYFLQTQTEQSDLRMLVHHVVSFFCESGFIPGQIHLITHASPALPEKMLVRAPEKLLRQVLVNLLKDAVEAIPGSGTIMITHLGMTEKDHKKYYALAIRDTGEGIPEALSENTPYSEIQHKKNHKRPGLNVVYSLLNQIDALITCQSDSKGTLFSLMIPAGTTETPNKHAAP